MYTSTKRWLKRNQTNFAIGFGVIGATYVAGQYAISKFSEMRERMTNDRIARENLRRRFNQNQEDCTFTVLALLPTAVDDILDAFPVEAITRELQQQRTDRPARSTVGSELTPSEFSSPSASGAGEDGKSSTSGQTDSFLHTSQLGQSTLEPPGLGESVKARKTKAQLWNDLKVNSITRAFTLTYTLALLTIFTRIQLNLLGRTSYVSSVVSMAAPQRRDSTISLENYEELRPKDAADFETHRNFLAFSWWLLHRGWQDLRTKIEAAVKETFGSLSPREEITFQRLSELVIETRKKIEGETEEARRTQKWLPYVLPSIDREVYVLHESGVIPRDSSPDSSSSPLSDPGIELDAPQAPSQPSIPQPPAISPSLRHLLDEASDIVDSPQANRTTTLVLDALFSQLIDISVRTQAFKSANPSLEIPFPRIQELGPDESDIPKAKLATILAVLTRQAHAIVGPDPNIYMQAMDSVRELEAFSAVVYSSNFGIGNTSGIPQEPASATLDEDEYSKRAGSIASVGSGTSGGVWGMLDNVWSRVTGSR